MLVIVITSPSIKLFLILPSPPCLSFLLHIGNSWRLQMEIVECLFCTCTAIERRWRRLGRPWSPLIGGESPWFSFLLHNGNSCTATERRWSPLRWRGGGGRSGRQSPLSIDGESGGLLPFNIDGDGGLLRNSCRPGKEEEWWGLEKKLHLVRKGWGEESGWRRRRQAACFDAMLTLMLLLSLMLN